MVVRRHPEAVKAEQLFIVSGNRVAIYVDANAFFFTAVESAVLQSEGDYARWDQLLGAAGLAPIWACITCCVMLRFILCNPDRRFSEVRARGCLAGIITPKAFPLHLPFLPMARIKGRQSFGVPSIGL